MEVIGNDAFLTTGFYGGTMTWVATPQTPATQNTPGTLNTPGIVTQGMTKFCLSNHSDSVISVQGCR